METTKLKLDPVGEDCSMCGTPDSTCRPYYDSTTGSFSWFCSRCASRQMILPVAGILYRQAMVEAQERRR